MQVQHDARARLARGRQRAPAERRPDVVGVHDARAAAPHRAADAAGRSPPPSSPAAAVPGQRLRVALEHGRRLAELGPDQPREVLDRALLPAGRAVAVVQEQDQRGPQQAVEPPAPDGDGVMHARHHAPLHPRADVLVGEAGRRGGHVRVARATAASSCRTRTDGR